MGSDSVTWRGVIGRNGLPDLNQSGVLLLGVGGPLLRAVRSLYDRSRSLVRIAGSKLDLFPVHAGLRQGCPLSPVLFISFMGRISRHSHGPEGIATASGGGVKVSWGLVHE